MIFLRNHSFWKTEKSKLLKVVKNKEGIFLDKLQNKEGRGAYICDDIKCLEKDLSFYGSGAILHELFFGNMGPAVPTSPNTKLMEQIIKEV